MKKKESKKREKKKKKESKKKTEKNRVPKFNRNLSIVNFPDYKTRFLSNSTLPESPTLLKMHQISEICAICTRRTPISEFQALRCGHSFHTICLSAMVGARGSSRNPCPSCRRSFTRDDRTNLFFNDPRCEDHCRHDGDEAAESVAPEAAEAVVVNPASGARSRRPTVVVRDGALMMPDDASSVSSMPSLETVDPDYVGSTTSTNRHQVREVTSDDLGRSIRHLFAEGVVTEDTPSTVVHAMAEADAISPPAIPEDASAERQMSLMKIERGALLIDISALEAKQREMDRQWATLKRQVEKLVREFDCVVRELFSAYVEDVTEAADFTRRNRFSFNNMNLRQGNAPNQRRAFETSMNITRGMLDGRHDGSVDFEVYNSRADGAINGFHPVPTHRYSQQASVDSADWPVPPMPAAVAERRRRFGQDASVGAGNGRQVRGRGTGSGARQASSRRPEVRIENAVPGEIFTPVDPDYPIIRIVSSGNGRQRQQQQRQQPPQGRRGGRQSNRSSSVGRQSEVGDRPVNRRNQSVGQGRRGGRPNNPPAAEQRRPNPRVNQATRRADRARNVVAATRLAMSVTRPSLAQSRDASRVVASVGASTPTPATMEEADEIVENLDASTGSAEAGERFLDDFLGMILRGDSDDEEGDGGE